MKTKTSALRYTTLLFVLVTVGSVSAEIFQHGNSTTRIEQDGGGTSRSEVTRYGDGQRVITRDGKNTDISVQSSGSTRAKPDTGKSEAWFDDRFDHRSYEDRKPVDDDSGSSEDEFKERMFERMRSPFSRW